jgi:hypothetical protein
MSSYKKVKGWSDTMREMLLTKRMPPWHADPHYGVFREDRSLTTEELKTLVSWIDAGAPAGQGADPLNDLPVTASEWTLGKPDYVVALSEPMQVPATGVVDYITNIVDSPILENAWLRAAVIRPDNRKVLHHVIVYLEYPPGPGREQLGEEMASVGPGAKMAAYPEGTGKFLPKVANSVSASTDWAKNKPIAPNSGFTCTRASGSRTPDARGHRRLSHPARGRLAHVVINHST